MVKYSSVASLLKLLQPLRCPATLTELQIAHVWRTKLHSAGDFAEGDTAPMPIRATPCGGRFVVNDRDGLFVGDEFHGSTLPRIYYTEVDTTYQP